MRRSFELAAKLDRFGMALLRLGLVIVLVRIGGLKFADYEADGIVPLVANSPLTVNTGAALVYSASVMDAYEVHTESSVAATK